MNWQLQKGLLAMGIQHKSCCNCSVTNVLVNFIANTRVEMTWTDTTLLEHLNSSPV